jgi:hypothetical protein
MSDEQMTVEDILRSYGVPLVHTPHGINAATQARDEAIDRVEKNADPDWAEAAYLACCLVAEDQQFFTTDNVWEKISTAFPQFKTHEPRAMGAVMRRAAKDGVVSPTDEYVRSDRQECHRRPMMRWESLIFESDEY